MIVKSYDYKKIDLKKNNIILLYGKNEGYKKEVGEYFKSQTNKSYQYDEKEILDNQNIFLENILNKSLFEDKKTLIIKRATDKIFKIIENIYENINEDLIIIFSNDLEKKSKLRYLFEKQKELICIPFYPDNNQTLSKLINNLFLKKNIPISQEIINQIINISNGDREIIFNEITKIENFSKTRKKLRSEDIAKLINVLENHSISELINSCLSKNKNKVIKILNENNYTNEDAILISRTFLNKSKKILDLSLNYEKNNDINLTISTAKPTIFWKDKEITILQIKKWSSKDIKNLIYKLSEIELIIKKKSNNSLFLITDFLLQQASHKSNN